ncbi:hypothetical protein TNCV_523041 [Trichonephila clavipes]|nr:hypothetical protein TNCV_523041 [Trichonephila clavipes]
MNIKLKNDIPVCQRARRLSCSEKLQVNNQIDDWLRQDGLCCSEGSLSLGCGSEEKRNRFEQTSRTLQRKISMRSTKDQLVKKDVLMPVKHSVFLWNLPDVEEMPSHDGETV